MARKKKKSNAISVDFSGVDRQPIIPEGDYVVTPDEVSLEKSDNGEYLQWNLEVTKGKYKGKKLFYITSLLPKALWNLANTLEAFGEEVPESTMDLDLEELAELGEAMASVEHDTYEGKKKNRVTDLFSAEDSGAADEDDEDTKDEDTKDDEDGDRPDEDDIDEMDEDDLEEVIDQYSLEVDLDDHKNIKKKRKAVAKAMEEAEGSDGEESGEGWTEDDINGMSLEDLEEVVEKADIDLEMPKKVKTARRHVIKALKEEDMITEE